MSIGANYSQFQYDTPFVSPAKFNEQTIVIDGFSKSHAMTGWRVGFVHGPREVVEAMAKLQQYTFVCAPQPAQWAGLRFLYLAITGVVWICGGEIAFFVATLAMRFFSLTFAVELMSFTGILWHQQPFR